jgi:hypothetical protein
MSDKAKARIAICKDVLKHIKSLDVVSGLYCTSDHYFDPNIDLSKQPEIKNCTV